ncbi:hypothetical protein HMPREF9180_1217 [Streptococcus peroris ATCC 700780]|uniref:Uncharacterized protein n=1 Tax=Streptococcus peroris ATCC 700780 TaxID=888746 RepID=E8KCL2_9STRE|nr:hypothetical protein HMPREF9180_1217 [Streptococcus peroris ATCC 700780]
MSVFSFAAHSFYKNSLILILINNTIKIGFIYLVAFLYYVNQFLKQEELDMIKNYLEKSG